ncbi:dermonecrotic toxin domain-containing protein [Pseudomonas azerbaijanoccidentalis]
MTEVSSPPVVPELPADQDALLTQLVAGPSIREVATHALQPALKKLYPQLSIDPRLAMVVTPTWTLREQRAVAGPRHFESLTDALVRHGIAQTPMIYLEGEHYLTLQPLEPTPAQLPVSIEAIGRLLNELAPLLFDAFQEQQVDYWNRLTNPSTPRWKALSHSLRELWDIETNPNWENEQCEMARNLFTYPDKSTRKTHDRFRSRACLIDLDFKNEGVSTHLNTLDMAVLIGTLGSRTLIVSHTITHGFQTYASLQELGESLQAYTNGQIPGNTLQWRLIEPEDNFFDHLACTLIALQADSISALANNREEANPDLAPHISRTTNELDPSDNQAPSRFNLVEQALPDWMASASSGDLTAYSRHLMDLASVQNKNAGQSFQDGIKPIREFALEQLRDAMLSEHPEAKDLQLENIEIVIDSVVVWGSFAPPVGPERTTLSLVDLALQNLIALPLGNKSIRSTSATVLPAWLTVSYLEALIIKVDIGQTYPKLIKSKLLDDPLESLRRQNLFTSRLRVELPLLALQQKIRTQGAVDELGYRYVAAVVQILDAKRWVDGQEIVIRPLAFTPAWRTGASTDEVSNMFVIGPRQMDKGPCLLYRPLLDQPLSQFPTQANLIYAIRHSPKLRESVLAWLPDGVRANYTDYVFTGDLPSVWSVSQLLGDPLTSLQMSGPLTLGTRVLATDFLANLYKADVNALVELAQRQSVSNAENRWATFKQAAWKILNAALPFLGRTVGTAAWIWQVLDDLQQTLDASKEGNAEQRKTAMTDLLLTLAMVLAHHASTRRPTSRAIRQESAATLTVEAAEKPVATPLTLVQLPDIVGEPTATQHRISVATDTVLNLSKTLDRFEITKPENLTSPDSAAGIHKHLYRHENSYYAPVGERWFEVSVEGTGEVSIIDSRPKSQGHGPTLISNQQGQWFVDTRLRLRGGGLSSRRKALKQQNRQRITELKRKLADFDKERESAKKELTATYNQMKTASDEALPGLQKQFMEKLDQRTSDYAAPIEQLKSLNLLDTVPNYRSAMVEMLGTQLFFNQTWLDQQNPAFAQTLRETLALLEAEEVTGGSGDRATYRKMIDLTEDVIDKIEFAQSRFVELSRLGRSAAEVASTYKTKLPAFTLNDLKALQVSLAREICLKESDSLPLTEARNEFSRLLDTTNLVIQTSQELMLEGSTWIAKERIEALNGMLEQFAAIDQSFEDFKVSHNDAVLEQPFKHLRSRVSEFLQETEAYMAQLLREQQALEPRPGPSRPTPVSRKRVIKTRFNGTVVGEVRPSAPGEPVLLEVRAPMTGKVIATFHEKTPGVWLERVPARRRRPPVQPPALNEQIAQGRTMLDGLAKFIRETEASAKKPGRIPVEIEEVFQHKADQIGQTTRALEQAVLRSNTTDGPASTASTLTTELNAARERLYAEGNRIRIEMTKDQPPTAARVQWLLSKEEIDIARTGERRRLKGPRKDYLQEYEIRERRTQKTLWYAHFHYTSLEAPVDAFTAAHLKLSEQRLLAGAFDLHSATTNPQVIAIYRSEISPQLARTLFFTQA